MSRASDAIVNLTPAAHPEFLSSVSLARLQSTEKAAGGPAAESGAAEVVELESGSEPAEYRHELAASGDVHFGLGHVTMPFNFSLVQVPEIARTGVTPQVGQPSRESLYYGATISYGWKQTWYLDVAIAQGSSSGSADVPLGASFPIISEFSIDDSWYQAYVRYAFPGLRGRRFSAYLRGGMSFVTAELFDESVIPALGLYRQTDKTDDLLGNLGFGITYSLLTTRRARLAAQFEGEAFYGNRTQDSTEELPNSNLIIPTTQFDNTLYGGIGRLTLRYQQLFGQWKAFADVGFQVKFTEIDYPEVGSFDEVLYGPYVKLGVRYSF